jgi:hypothetical protein
VSYVAAEHIWAPIEGSEGAGVLLFAQGDPVSAEQVKEHGLKKSQLAKPEDLPEDEAA